MYDRIKKDTRAFNVGLHENLHAWVCQEAAKKGMHRRDLVASVLQAAKDAQEAPPPKPHPRTKKGRFLAYVEEHWSFASAVVELKLSIEEVTGWLQDRNFLSQYHLAQRIYLDKIEKRLIEQGDGSRKGYVLGYVTFLNAHHPGYGRLRREQINRILARIVKKMMKLLETELGPGGRDQVKRISDKLNAHITQAVAVFTEASPKEPGSP